MLINGKDPDQTPCTVLPDQGYIVCHCLLIRRLKDRAQIMFYLSRVYIICRLRKEMSIDQMQKFLDNFNHLYLNTL